MKKDNKIFDKIVTKMNKYGNSISKNSEKVIQTAINSSEKLAKKISDEQEKQNLMVKLVKNTISLQDMLERFADKTSFYYWFHATEL